MKRAVLRLLRFVVVAVASVAGSAHAQTIALPAALYRKEPIRPLAQRPNWVNRVDCLKKDVLTFYPVTLGDYASAALQVWAGDHGVDCSLPKNRGAGDTGACWLVYGAPATRASTRVDVAAVDLVGRQRPTTSGADAEVAHGVYPDACMSSTSQRGVPLALHFMLVDSTANVVGAPVVWNDIGYDVVPPSPPPSVGASDGDTRLLLDWTPSPDFDVRAYRFYCDPAPGTVFPDGGTKRGLGALGTDTEVAAPDAEPSADAGASASAPSDRDGGSAGRSQDGGTDECSASTVLLPGTDPVVESPLDAYACGSAPSGEGSTTLEHLVNYVRYVVAVAAVDETGNVGRLSRQVCETPVKLTGFFDLYRQAGGKAGGGICSLARPPRGASSFDGSSAAALLALTGVAGVRCTRRRIRLRRVKRPSRPTPPPAACGAS